MEKLLKAELNTIKLQPVGRGGGGCISSGQAYATDSGEIFVKMNQQDGVSTVPVSSGHTKLLRRRINVKTLIRRRNNVMCRHVHVSSGPGVVVTLNACQIRDCGFACCFDFQFPKKQNNFFPVHLQGFVGMLCDRELVCSTSNRLGSHFESLVWMFSDSSHHPEFSSLACMCTCSPIYSFTL